LRQLLRFADGLLCDRYGIDWWDVLSVLILRELQQFLWLCRVHKDLSPGAEFFCSRQDFRAEAMKSVVSSVRYLDSARRRRPIRRYLLAAQRLSFGQIRQIAWDKFDPQHQLRRKLARRPMKSGRPSILLPSAYSNVSRALTEYAARMPEKNFLLVTARDSARLDDLPPNVRSLSLDPYFSDSGADDEEQFKSRWSELESKLVESATEFQMAKQGGILERVTASFPWGIAMRNAWNEVLNSEQVVGCLSADDNNPYTRIPLLLARRRGLPAVACHHGALDFMTRIKPTSADVYFCKSQIELDYQRRFCGVRRDHLAIAKPQEQSAMRLTDSTAADCLTVFTEPYRIDGWRSEEIWRELLPALALAASRCQLRIILKIHPFESVKEYRSLAHKFLSLDRATSIEVVSGPPSPTLWERTRVAITAESSAALEAATRGIPVFFLGWLREPHLGYMDQFERFGVGRVLNSCAELSGISDLLESKSARKAQGFTCSPEGNAEALAELLSGRGFTQTEPDRIAELAST
jgi:hypothetical protein